MQSRNGSNMDGIDVSHYEGNIDYAKVKASGIQVVYIKATEGTSFKDSTLNKNYQNAKANGLKVGFYHFFRASNEENARQQARFFVDTINGLDYDCRLALDLETTQNLNKNTLSNLAKIFMDELKRLTGKDGVIYTYTYFARDNITGVLSGYPLWIAHYGVSTPGNNPIWNSWIGFQYSDTGSIAGISGDVDLDEFTREILLDETNPVPENKPEQSWAITTVRGVQAALNARYGFDIDVDNIARMDTFTALYKAVQIELNRLGKDLKADGIPGPLTFDAVVTVRQRDKSNLVWLIQAILICSGVSVGTDGADGKFGSQTLAGVKNFQRSKGLTVDGIVGPHTWRKLLS